MDVRTVRKLTYMDVRRLTYMDGANIHGCKRLTYMNVRIFPKHETKCNWGSYL